MNKGDKINGYTVIHTETFGERTLLLVGDDREYVTGLLMPEVEGMRREWVYGNYRTDAAGALINYMGRYDGYHGTEYARVKAAVTESLSEWKKGAHRG